MTHVRRVRIAALALALGAAVAGCTSTSSSSSGAAGSSAAGGGAAGSARPADAAAAAGTGVVAPAVAPAVAPRVVRTADVVVEVPGELGPAAARVRTLAQDLGGTVSSETTTYAATPAPAAAPAGTDGAGAVAQPGRSLLVLRVPEASLGRALALVTGAGGVGTELSRSATAQDVTGDLADLGARVATQQASVQRVRTLLGRAGSLRDVVLLESEVAKREADLAAVQARRAALAGRADLATLTVDLRTAATGAAVPARDGRNAFVRGLAGGWTALAASTTVVLTVLGALLPIAVVAALVGGPVLWSLRRRRAARRAPAPAAPPSGG